MSALLQRLAEARKEGDVTRLAEAIPYARWMQIAPENGTGELLTSMAAFDESLRSRDPQWGLRKVEDFAAAAAERRLTLEQTRAMPANNLMLLLRKS